MEYCLVSDCFINMLEQDAGGRGILDPSSCSSIKEVQVVSLLPGMSLLYPLMGAPIAKGKRSSV